jgi:hypothetical protein
MQDIAPFTILVASSIRRANKAWPRLFMILLVLSLFFACYAIAVFLLLLFVQGALLRGMPVRLERLLEAIIAFIGVYALLRYNGAAGYAFALSSEEDKFFVTAVMQAAKQSWKNGIGFFFNSFNSGLLIVFGQTLAVCPCFLIQSNFIFSAYLYVYEGIRNKGARKRARELTKGFGWVILQRSAVFLLIGYIVIALLFLAAFAPHARIFLSIALVLALYASSLQSQFLREVYLESKQHYAAAHDAPPRRTWILSSGIVALIAIIVYYSIKYGLHLASLHH